MQLVPLSPFVSTTKEISENKTQRCDVYNELAENIDNPEGFHRFLDSCVNKVRRKTPMATEKTDTTPELRKDSALKDIVQKMRSPQTGLPFLAKQAGFCDETFLSYDAVAWLQQNCHLESIEEAKAICKSLLEKRIIRHASGNVK